MENKQPFNPVLLDIPDEFETERLLVRAPRPGDGAATNASVLETLDDLRRFPASMPWAMEDQPVEKTEEYARRVWCGGDEENERSWKVAERFGFEHEGTLESERCDPDGTRRTMRVYATTR